MLTFTTIITSICAFGTINVSAAKIRKYKDYKYTIRSNGSVEIKEYTGSVKGVVRIPEKIKGRKVAVISYLRSFANGKKTKKIVIPRYVKVIRNRDLRLSRTGTKISVDSKNTKFCSYKGMLMSKSKKTLYYVPYTDTETFTVPSTVVNIANNAFYDDFAGGSYKDNFTVKLPKGLKKIGANAFANIYGLKTIKLPDGLKTIGKGAFQDTLIDYNKRPYMGKITVPESVTEIGDFALGWMHGELEDMGYNHHSFLIKGYKGSAAEAYAKKHDIKFKAIG